MFKQLSNRVSAKTIEETFTDNDVLHVKDENGYDTSDISAGYNPTTGFSFDYPMRWLNDHSDFKAVGIRRLKVVPTAHVLVLNVYVMFQYNEGAIKETQPCRLPLTITSENSFEEIIHYIVSTLNNFIDSELERFAEKEQKEYPKLFTFTYRYDYKTGDLTINLIDISESTIEPPMKLIEFSIEGNAGGGHREENLNYFLKFLNQERTEENRDKLADYSQSKSFKNVWDRVHLQFHASFSDNRRGFIGLNNDFYENPSIFYDPPTNSSDFWIRFTTDGIHQILPRYCGFYIGICFVRNYKNSLVTK